MNENGQQNFKETKPYETFWNETQNLSQETLRSEQQNYMEEIKLRS